MQVCTIALTVGTARQAMARVRKTPKYRHLVKRLQAEQAASGKHGAAGLTPVRKRPSAKPKKARLGNSFVRAARACLSWPCGTVPCARAQPKRVSADKVGAVARPTVCVFQADSPYPQVRCGRWLWQPMQEPCMRRAWQRWGGRQQRQRRAEVDT